MQQSLVYTLHFFFIFILVSSLVLLLDQIHTICCYSSIYSYSSSLARCCELDRVNVRVGGVPSLLLIPQVSLNYLLRSLLPHHRSPPSLSLSPLDLCRIKCNALQQLCTEKPHNKHINPFSLSLQSWAIFFYYSFYLSIPPPTNYRKMTRPHVKNGHPPTLHLLLLFLLLRVPSLCLPLAFLTTTNYCQPTSHLLLLLPRNASTATQVHPGGTKTNNSIQRGGDGWCWW